MSDCELHEIGVALGEIIVLDLEEYSSDLGINQFIPSAY